MFNNITVERGIGFKANEEYRYVDKFKSNDGLKKASTNALKQILSDKLNTNDYFAEIPLTGSYKTIRDAVTSSKTNSASYYQLIANKSYEEITQLQNTSPDYLKWNLNKASAHILELVEDDQSVRVLQSDEETKWKYDGYKNERKVTYFLFAANPDNYTNWRFPAKEYEDKDIKYDTYRNCLRTIMCKCGDDSLIDFVRDQINNNRGSEYIVNYTGEKEERLRREVNGELQYRVNLNGLVEYKYTKYKDDPDDDFDVKIKTFHPYTVEWWIPLHTFAELVKDITVTAPKNKVVISQNGSLTEADKRAIRDLYKEPFVNAMKDAGDNSVDEATIRAAVDNAKVKLESGKLFISVPGMKTQVVNLSSITQTFDAAKQEATNTIKALTNLDENAKKPFLDQVTNAQKPEDVTKAVADAQIADAKAALEKKIEEANKKKSDVAYTKASDDKKQAFDGKLNDANTAKDAQDATTDSLNKARTDLEGAMNALDGAAQDLKEKKTAAKDKLKDYGLSDEDKQKFEGQIDGAQNEDDINKALLNAAKAALEKKIKEATDKKNDVAYTKASDDKKQAFDGKLNDANTAKDAQDATTDSLNKARTDLDTAMNALDGAAQDLKEKKTAAKDKLKDYGLSDEDKQKYEGQIDGAQNEDDINKALLNAAKAALEKKIEEANKKKSDVAYTKASDDKKQAFDGKLNDANTAKDAQDATTDSLNKARTDLEGAMNALDGAAIDEAEKNLAASKEALKAKITEAEAKKNDFAYTSASSEKKNEFDEKLQAAKDVRDKADAKIDEITAATKALNTAMDNLDGRAPDTEEFYALHTMYRLYNPYTHEHLFTTDVDEKDKLSSIGWRFEGTVGKVYMHGEKGGVYRLYNPTTGEHHYTTDENELAKCVKAGWKNEGVKFFSVLDSDKQTVGVVSMYNPYEKKFYHHYTSDEGEIAKMVKDGWRKEEIKWYAAK